MEGADQSGLCNDRRWQVRVQIQVCFAVYASNYFPYIIDSIVLQGNGIHTMENGQYENLFIYWSHKYSMLGSLLSCSPAAELANYAFGDTTFLLLVSRT